MEVNEARGEWGNIELALCCTVSACRVYLIFSAEELGAEELGKTES